MGTSVSERNRVGRRLRQGLVPGDGIPQTNRVVVENGEVKPLIFTETVELEEARALLHEVVRLEYSLP